MKKRKKPWGTERLCADESLFSIKILEIEKWWSLRKHTHRKKTVILFILKGEINCIRYGCPTGKSYRLKEGEHMTIDPGTKHRITGVRESLVIEISSWPEKEKVLSDE